MYKKYYGVIIVGDFNARINHMEDIFMSPEGSDNPHDSFETDCNHEYFPCEFKVKRSSKDNIVNNFGINLLDVCQATNCRILNGRVFNDKVGNLTRIGTTSCSVVNYMIVDHKVSHIVNDFNVCQPFAESDHCSLTIQFKKAVSSKHNVCIGKPVSKYVWEKESLHMLEDALLQPICNMLRHRV